MQFFHETNINFLEKRKVAYIISGLAILIGIISMIVHGGIEYSIEFTGGTSLQISFANPIEAGDLRNSIADIGFGNAEIKRIGQSDENEFIIRVEQMGEGSNTADVIEKELTKDFPDNQYDIRAVTEIGPKIGGELRRAAILAVFISLLGILIYISWRFEFKFAVGAVIALFHDVLITLGVFSILGLEISLAVVAAFLTIVGYSLNDTIVVFDRIRENLKIMRRENYINVLNASINQTLSRTIITSVTTLIVVLVLFVMGGKVIHNFSFALIIGVLVGTYSSIFVASPIVLEWQKRNEEKKHKKSTNRSNR